MPKLTVWRAPIDNDVIIKKEWLANYYDFLKTHIYKTEISGNEGNCVTIHSEFSLGGFSHFPLLKRHFKLDGNMAMVRLS